MAAMANTMLNPQLLLIVPLVVVPVFLVAWWRQCRHKNAGWVDVIWAFAVGATGVFYAIAGEGDVLIRAVVGGIYGVWFMRLGWHLCKRVSTESEDGRYAAMRSWAGQHANLLFFAFYIMQASWVWIFALPAWFLSGGTNPPIWIIVLALLIVVIAWAGESLADYQLGKFRHDQSNKGKTCRKGLWKYSRHPNYFFEWCHWLTYPILGLGMDHGIWLWVAPMLMYVFLVYVTGIPYTEKQALRSRGADYEHYQQTTSMFFPWKPKNIPLYGQH